MIRRRERVLPDSALPAVASSLDRIAVFIIAALGAILPPVFLPALVLEFYIPKLFVLVFAGASLGVIAAIGYYVRPTSPAARTVDISVAVFALAVLVSFVFSVSPSVSLIGRYSYPEGILTIGGYLLLYLGASRVRWDVRKIVAVAWGVTLGALLVCVYGAVQLSGLDPLNWQYTFDSSRVASTFGNPTQLAAYLAVSAPIVGLLIVLGGTSSRIVGSIVLAAVMGMLWASHGRAGLAGAAGAAAVIACSGLWKRWRGTREIEAVRPHRDTRRSLKLLTLSLSLMAVMVVTAAGAVIVGSQLRPAPELIASPAAATSAPQSNVNSLDDRLNIWASSLPMIAARPMTGWGPDLFELKYPQFQSLASARIESAGLQLGRRAEDAHNVMLEYAATLGLPGLTAFLSLLLTLVYFASSIVMKRTGTEVPGTEGASGSQERWVGAALLGLIPAFLIPALLTPVTLASATLFWLAAGMISSIAVSTGRSRSASRVLRTAVLAVTSVVSLLLLVVSVAVLAGDARVAIAEDAWQSRRPDLALPLYAQAASLNPWSDKYQGQYGLRLASYGVQSGNAAATEGGLAELDKARKMNPHEATYPLMMSRILLQPDAGPEVALRARALITNARSLAPNDARGSIYMAESLAITNAPGEVRQEELAWARAIAIAPDVMPSWIGAGELYLRTGRTSDAERIFRHVLSASPGDRRATEGIRRISAGTTPK